MAMSLYPSMGEFVRQIYYLELCIIWILLQTASSQSIRLRTYVEGASHLWSFQSHSLQEIKLNIIIMSYLLSLNDGDCIFFPLHSTTAFLVYWHFIINGLFCKKKGSWHFRQWGSFMAKREKTKKMLSHIDLPNLTFILTI